MIGRNMIMSKSELKLYAVRDPATGKLVLNITNPAKKFWQERKFAKLAIERATGGRYPQYKSLELVTFKLVEVEDDEQHTN